MLHIGGCIFNLPVIRKATKNIVAEEHVSIRDSKQSINFLYYHCYSWGLRQATTGELAQSFLLFFFLQFLDVLWFAATLHLLLINASKIPGI